MYQKVIAIGHVGADPNVHTFSDGTKKATFSIATKKKFKGRDGEQKEETTWIRVEVYRKLAEIAENYLRKGILVSIEGEIENRKYEKEGVEVTATSVVVRDFKILTPKNAGQGQVAEPNYNSFDYQDDEDLPF